MIRPNPPRALLALTQREGDLFFPGSLRTELRRLLPGALELDPGLVSARWPERVEQFRPEVIVTSWSTPTLPATLEGLRWVCHAGGSVRRQVPRALVERGVVVTNWGDCVSEFVAEGALLLALSALRKSQHFARLMHVERGWAENPGNTSSLFGRRVGFHGFGAIARRLAALLQPFRPRLAVFTTGDVAEANYAAAGVEKSNSLDELFETSDVLFELEALTPATTRMVTGALLGRLRDGAVFVNIGRGAVVDETALAKEAISGRLEVALDVFAEEPLAADSPLRGLPNVVLFPHVVGMPSNCYPDCGAVALDNLRRFVAGQPPATPVTLAAYDRST